ncbi:MULTISPECIES: hypothetical protein [Bradyrhizobium]|uniref:Uncharacterized protein n=1 Tax=Bradyrhizobium elkanii TaxID=29448 RepID=A0A8I1Y7K3_BRAEL|nr:MULTISPECIES: hypothetical protein [Bradyrhizobium]MBP1293459.1 hypothetical protein [Bradyrhizobium elkanii]MCP1925956.1 hypothetical protein [Bradyrhizobium elkanii]MCS3451516.1 hypothetical protein [Bradyrhizobium elkanii]MCS3476552.1 hypothetical protein [Bradyrhizobium elkanii]MCS3566385.1 hypothetical protein [Bradyrhizobium elkanii]
MQFWIKCTRFGKAEPYYVNISLVGGMSREGGKTILEFVGSNAQTIEVNETPEEILAIHLGASEGQPSQRW